jgi:hypothetical protein
MPEMSDLVNDSKAEGGLLSPVKSEAGSSVGGEGGLLSPEINDDEDLSAQAGRLLEGLGNSDDDGKVPTPRESIRMSRRRKDGASDERAQRRRRRQLAMSASEASLENHNMSRDSMASQASTGEDAGLNGSVIEEEDEEDGETPRAAKVKNVDAGGQEVIVTPPSPDGKLKMDRST